MVTPSAQKKRRLIVRLCLLLVAGFVATSLVSYVVSRSSLRHQIADTALPLTSDNIYSEIQRDLLEPVLISSVMANDTFLRDWVLDGENDEETIAKFLREVMTKYGMFTSFFVSERTRIYYHANGILKRVEPDEERDTWYFRVREMSADYEINVDPDLANRDALTIFINHRVLDYDGNYIGACGVGLTTDAMTTIIDSYRSKYNSNIYFIDRDGTIMLRGSFAWSAAGNIRDMEGMAPVAQDVLSGGETALEYVRNGHTVLLHARLIPELDWFLLVEQTEQGTIKSILGALALNLVVCVFITIITIILTTFTINAYERISQKQQEEIVAQHHRLLERNRALEEALAEVRTLSGFLPICASCKKIRDDKGYWQQIEGYIQDHSEAQFSHGICPDCAERLYPEDSGGDTGDTER